MVCVEGGTNPAIDRLAQWRTMGTVSCSAASPGECRSCSNGISMKSTMPEWEWANATAPGL